MRAVILLIWSLAFLSCRKNASLNADPARPQRSKKSNTASAVTDSGMKVQADKLLTSSEIESATGEPAKQAVTSARTEAGFAISQCYFQTATPAKSVVVTVTSRGPGPDAKEPNMSVSLAILQPGSESATGREARDYWEKTMRGSSERSAGEAEREDGIHKSERGEEEEKKSPPKKVDRVGDEAYWSGNRFGGALYVLKRNVILRISIGGPDDQETKITKSKALAEKALSRLGF